VHACQCVGDLIYLDTRSRAKEFCTLVNARAHVIVEHLACACVPVCWRFDLSRHEITRKRIMHVSKCTCTCDCGTLGVCMRVSVLAI